MLTPCQVQTVNGGLEIKPRQSSKKPFYVIGDVKTNPKLCTYTHAHTHRDGYINIAQTYIYVQLHICIHVCNMCAHTFMSLAILRCFVHFDYLEIAQLYDNESAEIDLVSRCY